MSGHRSAIYLRYFPVLLTALPGLAGCGRVDAPDEAEPIQSALVTADQYLYGDWNGDGKDSVAVRVGNCITFDTPFDTAGHKSQCYGNGNSEDQYLVGDWDGDGRDNLAIRRGNAIYMDWNYDGVADRTQYYGDGNYENQYLVGDWDGDGKDNLAVRRGHCVLMDTNFDSVHDVMQCYGTETVDNQYLVGDWDGDGRDNLAVRRGNCVLMDTDFDANGIANITQCYGDGAAETEYAVGDWNGDRRSNLAVRRDSCVVMDYNFDGYGDFTNCYGGGQSWQAPPPVDSGRYCCKAFGCAYFEPGDSPKCLVAAGKDCRSISDKKICSAGETQVDCVGEFFEPGSGGLRNCTPH